MTSRDVMSLSSFRPINGAQACSENDVMATTSEHSAAMTSRKELPSGYAYGDYSVLVPASLASAPASISTVFNPQAIAAGDRTSDASLGSSSSPVKKKQRAHGLVPVYAEQDLCDMEQSLQSLSRNNDKRKNYDALLTLLRKSSPVGMRKLAKVPRSFNAALDTLEAEMPNFRQVIATVRRMLALQLAGDGSFQLPPLLLAGDPGVGKTYFAMRLAKLMKAGFEMVSMEGASSPMSLIGLEQHYYTSSPGKVFEVLVQGETANPVFVVDELDKASSEARLPPANALY